MMMRGRWEARNPENETPRRNSSWANRKDGSTRSGGRMAKKAAKEEETKAKEEEKKAAKGEAAPAKPAMAMMGFWKPKKAVSS